MIHIAGLDVALEERYLRQRCAWCDAVLVDYDATLCMVQIPEDGSEPQGPGAWPPGRFVRVDGGASWVLDDGEKFGREDACWWATVANPEDFDG